MIVKVQYRKVVHEIRCYESIRCSISTTFRIPERRMKILYRGKIVSKEEELVKLVKTGKTLYLIGTPSKDQLDARVKCKVRIVRSHSSNTHASYNAHLLRNSRTTVAQTHLHVVCCVLRHGHL